ncbi:alpha/beta fold hydrolase [Agromyces sp. LHK192]|uniref:alpha/beta fold hydrolase n=1 Tax=Agromyces sp. LHK192 TaxID=2498704 RepID=UPI00196A6CD6|nr:alpha/beta hydrolase [Agromyces sp. LHK192]
MHGAFADASGFSGVIGELASAGVVAFAPPTPLRGVASDAASLRAVVEAVDGPVLLVGHSYGGAVVTQASAGSANVVGLVFLAAFAPAVGESCAGVQEPFDAPLLAETIRPTPYDALGAVGGPELLIDRDRFRETFCADVPIALAASMAVIQRPLAAAAIGEPLTAAGWTEHPSWYLVSGSDRAISPDAQRFMAERMAAVVDQIDASHVAFISRPVDVTGFILRALATL